MIRGVDKTNLKVLQQNSRWIFSLRQVWLRELSHLVLVLEPLSVLFLFFIVLGWNSLSRWWSPPFTTIYLLYDIYICFPSCVFSLFPFAQRVFNNCDLDSLLLHLKCPTWFHIPREFCPNLSLLPSPTRYLWWSPHHHLHVFNLFNPSSSH
jgi:hypothetical protein